MVVELGEYKFKVKEYGREIEDELDEIVERIREAQEDDAVTTRDTLAIMVEQLDVLLDPANNQDSGVEVPSDEKRETLAADTVMAAYDAPGSQLTYLAVAKIVGDVGKAARPT